MLKLRPGYFMGCQGNKRTGKKKNIKGTVSHYFENQKDAIRLIAAKT